MNRGSIFLKSVICALISIALSLFMIITVRLHLLFTNRTLNRILRRK